MAVLSMFPVGFANPYTWENVLYLRTVNPQNIRAVSECAPGSVANLPHMYLLILAVAVMLILSQEKLNPVYLCMMLGTWVLAIYMIKNIYYAGIGTSLFMASHCDKISALKIAKTELHTKKGLLIVAGALAMAFFLSFAVRHEDRIYDQEGLIQAAEENLPKGAKVFTHTVDGSDLQLAGYRYYMNSNMEQSGPQFNHVLNLREEGSAFASCKISIEKMQEKYGFDGYVLLQDMPIAYEIRKNPDYRVAWEDKSESRYKFMLVVPEK
jgi:hypothetical protein